MAQKPQGSLEVLHLAAYVAPQTWLNQRSFWEVDAIKVTNSKGQKKVKMGLKMIDLGKTGGIIL